MENNKKYCILCGVENNGTDKFCHKCGESLDQKDDDLKDYAVEKVKDKVKDTVEEKATDTFLDLLKKFLNSKAYGFILSLSVIAAVGNMLAGGTGTKVNEFSNDIPGMFIDGYVYGVTFDSSEILVEHGLNLYGKRDASGNVYMLYLDGSTSYYADYYVTVTGSDGKVLRQDELMHYDSQTETSQDYLVAIDDLYSTIEIKYNHLTENRTNVCTVKMNGPVGVKSLTEYENDELILSQEFYDTGVEKYFYRVSGYMTFENGERENSTEETFYNEKGEEIKFIAMSGDTVVSSRIREDLADGSYKLTSDYNGLLDRVCVRDSQDRIIEDCEYSNGVFNYKKLFEYYESGEMLSESYYSKETDEYPTTVKYYDVDGTVKQEIRYYTDKGTIRSDTVYDGNGSAVSKEYYYDNGNISRLSNLQQRDDGVYNAVKIISYDRDGNVTRETEYDLQGELLSDVIYD